MHMVLGRRNMVACPAAISGSAVTIEDAASVSGPLDADHLVNLSLLIRCDFSDQLRGRRWRKRRSK